MCVWEGGCWHGGGSAQLALPLPWALQTIVVTVADVDGLGARHCGSRGAGVAPAQTGITFHLRRAVRLHCPPCAPESLPVRKGMVITGRGRQWVHTNGIGSIPESQGAPQQRRANPSALTLPEAGHRAEGLARAVMQHRSPGCRYALLWQQLGGHGFPDVSYKHPIAFPELRPPTLWTSDGESMGMWLAAQATRDKHKERVPGAADSRVTHHRTGGVGTSKSRDKTGGE